MKKTAKSLSILMAILAATLTGCDVKAKKDNGKEVLFTVDGKNIVAEDLLGFEEGKLSYNFLSTDEGVEAVYNAVYEALASKHVEETETIKEAVNEKMEDWEDEVESYASSNGVSVANARKTKLEELGYDSKDELRQHYTVEEKKEQLLEDFENATKEPETVDAISATGSSMIEEYVTKTSPMIVKHILTKVADSAGVYQGAEITTAEADKFVSVIQRLAMGKANGNTFKAIAADESEDGASKGGNLGIVDTYTSFVAEFKEGLYLSEIINSDYNENYIKAYTGLTEQADVDAFKADAQAYAAEINYIPVVELGAVLEFVREDNSKAVQEANGHEKTSEYDADLYPRNLVYNHYLNNPHVQYLMVNDLDQPATIKANIVEILKVAYPGAEVTGLEAKADEIMNSNYFKAFANANAKVKEIGGKNLVVDENEMPIVVAKSSYGFHFISVTWSTLRQADIKDAIHFFMYNKTATAGTYGARIEDSGDTMNLNYGYSSPSSALSARKSEIETRVTNYFKGGFESVSATDSLYEAKMIKYFMNQYVIDYATEEVKTAVNDYINQQQDLKNMTIALSQRDTWDSYFDQIEGYNEAYNLFFK